MGDDQQLRQELIETHFRTLTSKSMRIETLPIADQTNTMQAKQVPASIILLCLCFIIQLIPTLCVPSNVISDATNQTLNSRISSLDLSTTKGIVASLPLNRFSISALLNIPKVELSNLKTRGQSKCGQRIPGYDNRIVGGHIATIAEFPWMISLQREKSNWFGLSAFYHSCGGSLITESWIVTAAHCLYNRDEPLRAVAGTDNLNFLYRAQLREITRQIIHPNFDIATYDNDVALVKVDKPYNLESSFSHVGKVCLDRETPVMPYDIATICGFGSRAFHEKTRSHLYETEIAIIDGQTCNKAFGGMITDNMICAGGMVANKRDACSGDSGGPLTMDTGDDRVSLVGVVSFGNDCAVQNFPGIYTKLSNYFDWISNNIDEPLESSS